MFHVNWYISRSEIVQAACGSMEITKHRKPTKSPIMDKIVECLKPAHTGANWLQTGVSSCKGSMLVVFVSKLIIKVPCSLKET